MKALEDLSGYDEADVKAALIVDDDADQPGGAGRCTLGRVEDQDLEVWSQWESWRLEKKRTGLRGGVIFCKK